MKYDFDDNPDRHQTESLKWQTYDPDIIPMWVADMDFRSPEPVIQALVKRVQHGVYGYPAGVHASPDELPGLRQAVLEHLSYHHHWEVEPEALIFLPGVVTAFNLASLAYAAPDGGVLVQTPVYPPMLIAAKSTGAVSQEMELTRLADGSYIIDWEAFEAAFTTETRMFLLCNPHNPVGRVFHRKELERMAEICLRKRAILCSDEIHCDLIYPGHRHIPIASLDREIAEQTITLVAPSKTFNLAGLQCSIAIIQNSELRKRFLAARKGLVPWVNLMGLVAAEAAYRSGGEWLEQLLVYLQGNRDLLVETVHHELPGIEIAAPEGTYLAWLDCRKASLPDGPYQYFIKQAGVAFNDGATFGKGGEGFIRFNFGCSRNLLIEVLKRMKKCLPA
jgi:cystathionine beta-lyase